ncbi:ABC transporter ATP-binding protein [Ferrimonas lipolytica]|uniref:ABC-type dipeptide transporter n=1 Tax=Ferrimonas lipolytica TaxID=2724191 RepID=A0A6H1UCL1_9GAMM|nr:ABC transporter ATP-binding protein [Ferrimonas lipolytica]QIZ76320.1 ABC transporter ATP-binding protein [Ferrimonas lipolytica]
MNSAEATPLVDVQSLCINYAGGANVVEDVSFTLLPGQIVGIVGESGSGKTTLIRAIINLLGSGASIEAGHIWFDGVDTATLTSEGWRQLRGNHIAMIFQNPGASLSPMLTIERQFVEAIRNHRDITKAAARAIALAEISKLGLDEPERVLASRPWQLSGGMKQRVAIAMSLAMKPQLIIADEPTSALDVTTQELVMKELELRRRIDGSSVILVSHNISACASVADKLLVMQAGKVNDSGSVADILGRAEDSYAGQLLRSVPHLKVMTDG